MIMQSFELVTTTQGPLYPPAEVVDAEGHFIVVGNIVYDNATVWGMARVDKQSVLPPFGQVQPYHILKDLSLIEETKQSQIVLYTLPLPLPCHNYPMIFAPEQFPKAQEIIRPSYPLHRGYIYDFRPQDGRRELPPITLTDWLKAKGNLTVTLEENQHYARFNFHFNHLIANSLYGVMSLREQDLSPIAPTRPGPLGIPNLFITDEQGKATYTARLPHPFPIKNEHSNRIINVIILFLSSQQSYGGAIGQFGLGGDVHAQLKLISGDLFDTFVTYPMNK